MSKIIRINTNIYIWALTKDINKPRSRLEFSNTTTARIFARVIFNINIINTLSNARAAILITLLYVESKLVNDETISVISNR